MSSPSKILSISNQTFPVSPIKADGQTNKFAVLIASYNLVNPAYSRLGTDRV